MVRQRIAIPLNTVLVVCVLLAARVPAHAEIRKKPAGAGPSKPLPKKSSTANEETGREPRAAEANVSARSKSRDPLADDDSPDAGSSTKKKKDATKNRRPEKGDADSKASADSRSGRPRNVDPPSGQQGIVAPELDLEPET